ncbi:hypothetical protein D3C87_1415650 [compost metagenome]
MCYSFPPAFDEVINSVVGTLIVVHYHFWYFHFVAYPVKKYNRNAFSFKYFQMIVIFGFPGDGDQDAINLVGQHYFCIGHFGLISFVRLAKNSIVTCLAGHFLCRNNDLREVRT